ncbi:MAG: phosphoenolpyruvate--protein phosphotransferase [Balneolaceae bacterium]|nr:MAG: phosphoenolpyruvate--protein phosphotransferase [Balneolaceae bacterium]
MNDQIHDPALKAGEQLINGQAASPGYAIGIASLFNTSDLVISTEPVDESQVESEYAQFVRARRIVVFELRKILEIASATDEEAHGIIQAQIQIAEDPELDKSIRRMIMERHFGADRAVNESFLYYIQLIKNTGNALMIDRIVDIRDIRDRLIRQIQHGELVSGVVEGSVVICDELMPSDILLFSRHKVTGIAANEGGLTAHATIIANSMGIPLVINAVGATRLTSPGDLVIVDGVDGRLVVRPDASTLESYERAKERYALELAESALIVELPSVTKCGTEIVLMANIEFEEELDNIKKYRARGIGLLRTESYFIEDEGLEEYKSKEAFFEKAVKAAAPGSVTIRLFDVGGDKFSDTTTKEPNPFLGWRGVRVLLDRRQLLRSQLTAIMNVAGRNPGKIRILVPMVSVVEEIGEICREVDAITEKMRSNGKPFDPKLKIGTMIEIPSAALIAGKLAGETDFFSVGTNDLTQYTLAVDRGNRLISKLFQQMHPAVFQLIKKAADAAHEKGISIEVCGELAANPDAALCLVGMGITDLSMSAASLPRVKKAIRKYSIAEMAELSAMVLNAATQDEVQEILENWKKERDESH